MHSLPGPISASLMRSLDRATLSTGMAGQDGWPYGSFVMVAVDQDGSPVLLSDLAEHTANLKADARVSLLFDGTTGLTGTLDRRACFRSRPRGVDQG